MPVARRTASPAKRSPSPAARRTLPPGLGLTPRSNATKPAAFKLATPKKAQPKAASPGWLPCIAYVVAYHAAAAGALVWWHREKHAVVSPVHAALAVFCVINVWICVCEISLLCNSALIQRQYAAFTAKHGLGVLPPVFLFERVTLAEVLSLRYWAVMWSTYSALDPSYSDTTTFGFCVDCGNGVTTLLPTALFAVGMSGGVLPARWIGMVGLVKFYQELYGTVVYFFQYCFNKRYARTPRAHVWGVVVVANAIWIVFPALGMWASGRLILEGRFDVFAEGYKW